MNTPTSYDKTPYSSHAYQETHPSTLQTLVYLYGLDPPPLEECRVLELGCASGGNLLPMAYTLPRAHFVGVDYSQRQIDEARRIAEGTGLRNVELRCQSIETLPRDLGEFDYIIVHGVYSWVPQVVQERILHLCRDNLSPNGVAFISFNTLPGWYVKMWIRQCLLLLGRGVADDEQRVRRGIEFIEFLVSNEPHAQMPICGLLKQELGWLKERPASYIIHEYLEDINQPLFFDEFAEHLARCQLRYLCDGRVNGVNISNHPVIQRFLAETSGNLVLREQYLDFLTNRAFRRALVVRTDRRQQTGTLDERLPKLHAMTHCRPQAMPPGTTGAAETKFVHPTAGHILVRDPGLQAAMLHLAGMSPRTVPVEDLLERVRTARNLMPDQWPQVRTWALRELLQYVLTNLVHVYLTPPKFRAEPSERPRCSALVRFASQTERRVTSLRHEPVDLDPNAARFVQLCDGTRSVADLVAALPGSNETVVRNAIAQMARQAMLEDDAPA